MGRNIRYGFVPPGHQAIMAIQVLHAWPHETGAWLSLQAIGRDVALIWRACDSWKATAFKVAEIDRHPTREQNYDMAFEVGSSMVEEGPPPELLASAKRSAEARKAKAIAAAEARWRNHAKDKAAADPDIAAGPNVDSSIWKWRLAGAEETVGPWRLKDSGAKANEFSCSRLSKNRWSLTRYWHSDRLGKAQSEHLIKNGSLRECFAAMETLAKRDVGSWEVGEAV